MINYFLLSAQEKNTFCCNQMDLRKIIFFNLCVYLKTSYKKA